MSTQDPAPARSWDVAGTHLSPRIAQLTATRTDALAADAGALPGRAGRELSDTLPATGHPR